MAPLLGSQQTLANRLHLIRTQHGSKHDSISRERLTDGRIITRPVSRALKTPSDETRPAPDITAAKEVGAQPSRHDAPSDKLEKRIQVTQERGYHGRDPPSAIAHPLASAIAARSEAALARRAKTKSTLWSS